MKQWARGAVIGMVLATGAATAASAVTVVINPPSKRTRVDACSFLKSVAKRPDPFAAASGDAGRAHKQAVSLARRARQDVCVAHRTYPDPPIFADGSQHFGAFQNGKPEGLGVRFYADGSRYIGEWKDGLRQGEGMGVQADGARYVGHWDKDKPAGKGVVQYHQKIEMTVAPK